MKTVPSLPTRNGNWENSMMAYLRFIRSQPTYKEWKLSRSYRNLWQEDCSQPTYKEWKQYESPIDPIC